MNDPAAPPVLTRLRNETRSEHDAVEASLGLAAEGMTRARYRRVLERFYGFYLPLERAVRADGGWTLPGLEDRRKSDLLAADLEALGADDPDRLPVCRDLPRLDTEAEAFGCLYVMEGATLGGRLISRHIQRTLGVTPETGGRFFHGYGDRTGAMWQTFRAELAAFATGEDAQDQVVDSAVLTFRTLREWCEKGSDA